MRPPDHPCVPPVSAHGFSNAMEYCIRLIDVADDITRRGIPLTPSKLTAKFPISRATAYRHINAYKAARGLP